MASTAASSTGATEHASSTGAAEHVLALASTNIGLPGDAIDGPNFERNHGRQLRQIFTDLLGGNTNHRGLLICEVGNVGNLCSVAGKMKVEACIIEAFACAGAAEHFKMMARQPFNERVLQSTATRPHIYWHSTCVAAFVDGCEVRELPPLLEMFKLDRWRCAQRFKVRIGDIRNHGWLLVYNTHQPASDKHIFPQSMCINFCKAIAHDATAAAKEDRNVIGFVLMGDANCTQALWSTAMWEVDRSQSGPTQLWQQGASVQKGVNQKKGDLWLAMGSNLKFPQNTCRIRGREAQHDPMYFQCVWKGWTLEQRVLQSSLSNQVEMQISKRLRLSKEPIQHQAVPIEDPWTADNERGAAEHDNKEVAGQGEEDKDEEEDEDEEEDQDRDEDEDKDDDEKEGASEHDERRGHDDDFEPSWARASEDEEEAEEGALEHDEELPEYFSQVFEIGLALASSTGLVQGIGMPTDLDVDAM